MYIKYGRTQKRQTWDEDRICTIVRGVEGAGKSNVNQKYKIVLWEDRRGQAVGEILTWVRGAGAGDQSKRLSMIAVRRTR